MEGNFATRLKLFMDTINVQSSQFADSCEIPRPSFSQLLSGRNQKVSDVLVRKIHAAYPDLSIMWLMFGEGQMLVSNASTASETNNAIGKTTKNPGENQESFNLSGERSEYSNVKGLNVADSAPHTAIYQQLEDNKKIMELQLQIEKLKKNPRRVTQINVYYDDSTFDTFVPMK